MAAARTYSVMRNSRPGRGKGVDTVEASGLPLEEARRLQETLAEKERTDKPDQTSWTRDVFWLQLELFSPESHFSVDTHSCA